MADIAQVEPPEAAETAPIVNIPIDPSTALFRIRPFRLLFITRVASTTAVQMLAVVVGWHVYELTDSALQLGMIGLIQVLPPLLLMLAAGQVADHYNRRLILRCCYAVAFCSAAGLVLVAALPQPSLVAIYVLLLVNASARVFEQPVMQALVPVMAPRAVLNRAIAAHVSARQLSVLIGPSLGGILYVFGAAFDYGVCALLFLAAAVASLRMPNPGGPAPQTEVSADTLLAGFRFIGGCPSVLGAMLLDLVSTLFGGVNAVLPIYARDILDVGAWGAGVLRSAPALGALVAAAVLTRAPVRRAGGTYLLAGFAVVGAATIVFGLSSNLLLSVAALMVMGSGDMLSSVVRQTLILVTTPDGMRGRVSAVNALFYGTSGQLGAFRAGTMAAALGAVGSVVIGGCAILATVALWPWLFPALRRVDRPDLPQPY
ncbi:MAG TPA: MFS transporter [Xanthobacteraceae bacterium]